MTYLKNLGLKKTWIIKEVKEMTDKECEIETSKAIMEMRKQIEELKEQCLILADCNTC